MTPKFIVIVVGERQFHFSRNEWDADADRLFMFAGLADPKFTIDSGKLAVRTRRNAGNPN